MPHNGHHLRSLRPNAGASESQSLYYGNRRCSLSQRIVTSAQADPCITKKAVRMLTRFARAAVIVVAILLIHSEADCKYGRASEDRFFGRQPSARGESMGRGTVAMSGDILSSLYNPAGLADMLGLSFSMSFSDGSQAPDMADQTFLGAGVPVTKHFGIGFSRCHFEYETEIDHPGKRSTTYTQESTIHTLTIAAKPAAGFYVGLNLSLFSETSSGATETTLWPDVGVLKMFYWKRSGGSRHRLSLGGSLSNLTGSGFDTPEGEEELPVTLRVGTSYRVASGRRSLNGRLRTLGLLCHLEYQDVLKSAYRDAYKIGTEIQLVEILALRGGYYIESIDSGEADEGREWIGNTTYGLGLGLPIGKLAKDMPPLRISLDWASYEDPSDTAESGDAPRLSVYTLSIDWFF